MTGLAERWRGHRAAGKHRAPSRRHSSSGSLFADRGVVPRHAAQASTVSPLRRSVSLSTATALFLGTATLGTGTAQATDRMDRDALSTPIAEQPHRLLPESEAPGDGSVRVVTAAQVAAAVAGAAEDWRAAHPHADLGEITFGVADLPGGRPSVRPPAVRWSSTSTPAGGAGVRRAWTSTPCSGTRSGTHSGTDTRTTV